MSSGSSLAERAVELTRSQNITVSWRRSADDEECFGSAPRGAVGRAGVAVPPPSLTPQSPQNLALGGLTLPQEHRSGAGTPHSMQKRLPSGISARQLGHSIPVPTFREGQH